MTEHGPTRAIPILATLLLLGGCTNGYSSGVDSTKPFNTLTPAEATTACVNFADYLDGQLSAQRQWQISCTIEALGSTTNPEECNASVTACLGGDSRTLFGSIDCSGSMVSADCGATVGQVEGCINAEFPPYLDKLDMANCSIAGNIPALQELMQRPPVPSECSSLASVCPELADGLLGG